MISICLIQPGYAYRVYGYQKILFFIEKGF